MAEQLPVALAGADEVSAGALCDAFNASFADYLLAFPKFDAAGWQTFVRRQGCDLSASFVARQGDLVAAFALITPRPLRRTRLAVMGARPEARGTGIAARLLDHAIAAAIARGDRWIELEAFAQNERAVRLYLSREFVPVDALHGYVAEAGVGTAQDCDVVEVLRDEAALWAREFDQSDPAFLPWQAGGEAMLAGVGEMRAWRFGSAQLVFQGGEAAVSVSSLLDHGPAQNSARHLLTALRHRFPERTLRAPQLHRKHGAARAFEDAGWVRDPLHQLLLRRHLAG